MNNETYHARPELSNSMMTKLLKSPAHLKFYLDHPEQREPTPAMILGTQVHTALLEPGEWTQYARGVEGDRRTKAVKAEHQKLLEQYSPDQIMRSRYSTPIRLRRYRARLVLMQCQDLVRCTMIAS